VEAAPLLMHVAPRAVQDSQSDLSAKFTAAHRLLRENGFDHVVRAENISDRHFKIFFVHNGKENARLGMIVGKKTLARATDRNRMKRVIREAFRQHSVKQYGLDLVVMLRRNDPQEEGVQVGNLKMLFNRVESRCAES
jgi:ribonuclease P protein component